MSERDQTRDGSVGPSGQGLCGGDGPVGRRARGASAAAQIGVRRPRLARWWVGSGSPARRSVGHGARRVPSARCCRSPGPSPRRPGPGRAPAASRTIARGSARAARCWAAPGAGCAAAAVAAAPRGPTQRGRHWETGRVWGGGGGWAPSAESPVGRRCQRGRATRGRACLSLLHLPRWVLLEARGRGPGPGGGAGSLRAALPGLESASTRSCCCFCCGIRVFVCLLLIQA